MTAEIQFNFLTCEEYHKLDIEPHKLKKNEDINILTYDIEIASDSAKLEQLKQFCYNYWDPTKYNHDLTIDDFTKMDQHYDQMITAAIMFNNSIGLAILWRSYSYYDRLIPYYPRAIYTAAMYGNVNMLAYTLYARQNYTNLFQEDIYYDVLKTLVYTTNRHRDIKLCTFISSLKSYVNEQGKLTKIDFTDLQKLYNKKLKN